MKKIVLLLLIVTAFSCKKEGKYCWRCQVTGGIPYRDEIKDTCTDDPNNPPQFRDANNNPLNEFCNRR